MGWLFSWKILTAGCTEVFAKSTGIITVRKIGLKAPYIKARPIRAGLGNFEC